MKKIIGIFMFMLCSIIPMNAQNTYLKVGIGADFNEQYEEEKFNLNTQFGYFFNNNSAIEFDYSHGFKSELSEDLEFNYNRFGLNYLYEFNTTSYITPIVKCGLGAKVYDLRYFSSHSTTTTNMDMKLGVGVQCYVDNNVSVNVYIDFSNDFYNFEYDDWSWEWKTFSMTPQIGIAYNF